MRITLVTGNENKLKEWERLLPNSIELIPRSVDIPEMQSMDLEEIVADKASKAYRLVSGPVIVEDVSVGLNELNGLPGPFIKFFIESLGPDALYKLSRKPDSEAKVVCSIAYCDKNGVVIVSGETKGTISKPRGENGFGFDRTFIPDSQSKTYAEMTAEEKDEASHRSKAIMKLIQKLK